MSLGRVAVTIVAVTAGQVLSFYGLALAGSGAFQAWMVGTSPILPLKRAGALILAGLVFAILGALLFS